MTLIFVDGNGDGTAVLLVLQIVCYLLQIDIITTSPTIVDFMIFLFKVCLASTLDVSLRDVVICLDAGEVNDLDILASYAKRGECGAGNKVEDEDDIGNTGYCWDNDLLIFNYFCYYLQLTGYSRNYVSLLPP